MRVLSPARLSRSSHLLLQCRAFASTSSALLPISEVLSRSTRRCYIQPSAETSWFSRQTIQHFSTATIPDEEERRTVAKVVHNGTAVRLCFDEEESTFHAPWLWCHDPTYIHPSSGQRLRSYGQFPGWNIVDVQVVEHDNHIQESRNNDAATKPIPPPPAGCLHPIGTLVDPPKTSQSMGDSSNEMTRHLLLRITWDNGSVSFYDWKWMQQCRYDDIARQRRAQRTGIASAPVLGRHSDQCATISEMNFDDLFPSLDASVNRTALFQALDGVAETGAILIRNTPTELPENDEHSPVARVGRAMGGGSLSHGGLYGDVFHVKSQPKAHNIAYTSVSLCPHQDLAYYESKPGLQLLHCLCSDYPGGESTLVDSMAAAEALRYLAPQHFATLVQCQGTWIKQRALADMVYMKPHIVLGCGGEVVAVHWSPPFEGPPLGVPEERMEDYVRAYAAFERMVNDQLLDDHDNKNNKSYLLRPELHAALRQYATNFTWEYKLQPGDMLVFNNQRMLHGRRAFDLSEMSNLKEDEESLGRHLMGCYTNIDETINAYRVLLREQPERPERTVRGFGNGSSGSP